MAEEKSGTVGEVIAVILLMAALSVPGWYVTHMMIQGLSRDTTPSLAPAVGVLLIFILVAPGLALFFARRGRGRGNLRAAIWAIVAAAIFLVVFYVAGPLGGQETSGSPVYPTGPEGSDTSASPWAFAIIGGPVLLLIALAWAALSNKRMSPEEERRSEEGARRLHDELDEDSRARDAGRL